MTSLAAVCRSSARLARGSTATARAFTTSTRCLAAQNFSMPALSPTMTEGNIASWNVKEGDAFSAGDVLLEIETDKATMDVEAQEDGIMMKIMAGDGSKSVQVGTRIAVLAESGDDISSLELPPDEQTSAPKAEKEAAPAQDSTPEPEQKKSASKNPSDNGTYEHKHPLLPSVEHLVKQHGVSESDLSKIKPSGPSGRLLKGDVLAYLGTIKSETPATLSAMWDKLSHLDLSNIKVAEKKAAPKKEAEPVQEEEALPEVFEINVPVSLAKVVEAQKKIQQSLGVFLPMSTFISRAADVANDDLPLPVRPPTSSELFDQVLGLDKVKGVKGSRGIYLPQISAIPPTSMLAPRAPPKSADIFDILSAPAKKPRAEPVIPVVPGLSNGDNVFSLVVPKGEEERAHVFLERCKAILEQEPGRLVL
ncbi:biotin-requiring enzyme domain-containing protein [Sarocladium implicatum]|nr:biotin-requiring enzyme domain-containing protein [Sarocladium implicatum]